MPERKGSVTCGDERRAARELERRTRGRWLCWYGQRTRRFWAMPRSGRLILAEGETLDRLVRKMTEVDAFLGCQLDGSWRPL